ncbi:class I SAM-dependent methyltransferase [candidate division CSSED10-310 bacterium]|uniref:Class I SAM-dependent methyltransferase n=1 Tax=candidate division CSSED10-310 bacterium TaxID=2855610 RepID=A0ABV6YQW3_UNCC1
MISSDYLSDPIKYSELYIHDQVQNPQNFNAVIGEQDEMFLWELGQCHGNVEQARWRYFAIGKQLMESITSIVDWRWGNFSQVRKFLDFGCGYGRLTRFLINNLPPQRIWGADIQRDAVKFQVAYHAINGLISTSVPEEFKTEHRFDCIYVVSLFSHLPPHTFQRWLEVLYNLLDPSGILIMSTHSMSLLPPQDRNNNRGILFFPDSESRALDKNEYGATYVTEAFMRQVIKRVTGQSIFRCIKRGLCGWQDLYLISKSQARDMATYKPSIGPFGSFDGCKIDDDGRVSFWGWACELREKYSNCQVLLFRNGELMKCKLDRLDRPDVTQHIEDSNLVNPGWSFTARREQFKPDDVVMIKLVGQQGIETVIHLNAFQQMLQSFTQYQ